MRPHRLNCPEAFFHVTARGNNRQDIFATDFDKSDYLNKLSEIFPVFKIRIVAWCLMTNHLHFLLQDTVGGNLSKAMQRLQGNYAREWNKRYNRTGTIYERRYHAEPVQNDGHLIDGSLYIHDNARKAGLVASAEEYEWSSASAYLGGRSIIPVCKEVVLDLCSKGIPYARMLEEWPARVKKMPSISNVREQAIIGSTTFQKTIEPLLNRRTCGRDGMRRPRGLSIDEIARVLLVSKGIGITEICGAVRTREVSCARAIFCAMCHREGITTSTIARLLNRTFKGVLKLAREGQRHMREARGN